MNNHVPSSEKYRLAMEAMRRFETETVREAGKEIIRNAKKDSVREAGREAARDAGKRFGGHLTETLNLSASVLKRKPVAARQLLRIIGRLPVQALKRERQSSADLPIPPLMIVSVTRSCNLRCAGCYDRALHADASVDSPHAAACHSHAHQQGMTPAAFDRLLTEAEALGIAVVMIAGGEPLMRKDLLEVASRHDGLLFPIFTNGTLLDVELRAFLAAHPHLVPVLSLEGDRVATDARRGEGVYQTVMNAMETMRSDRQLFGVSVTATEANLDHVTSNAFAEQLVALGADICFFVEFVPQREEERKLALDAEKKQCLGLSAMRMQQACGLPFLAFPGDEDEYGGCLAAGRGFLHVSSEGELTPCPFSRSADTNAIQMGLKRAMASPLLAAVRRHHHELAETVGGCALAGQDARIAAWMAEEELREAE